MEPIKQEIINNIFENGDKLITGPILQTVLIDMIDDVNVKDQEILSKTGSWDDAVTQIPNLATKEEVTNLSESIARDLENVVDVDLTGYATEQWVQNQGYLTEHQDISNLVTKSELTEAENNLQGNITSLSESVARDLASVPEGVATEEWVQSQDYASKSYVDNAVSSSSVDLTGYATETWVQSQGYLTEHQDISNLATKTELNDTKDLIQDDMLILSESMAKAIDDYARGLITEIQNQDYASKIYVNEAVAGINLSDYATKSELTSVSESVQTDITNLSESVASSVVWKKGTGTDSIVQGITDPANLPTASGLAAVAMGLGTEATGDYSHAEGKYVQASGYWSHAEGQYVTSSGEFSHAEGWTTEASNQASHAEGETTTASGRSSHAEGHNTEASGSWSHAEGDQTTALGGCSHAEGNHTTASAGTSHAEGSDTLTLGWCGHAEGQYTTASVHCSHAEGHRAEASGSWSHAEGNGTRTLEQCSHAEGNATVTLGSYSHAEGNYTTASGGSSHAEGDQTKALGDCSHAEGTLTNASGESSHAEGAGTVASGAYSHAEGGYTVASNACEHAQGRYNHNSENQIFSIGTGNNSEDRRNAVSVLEVSNNNSYTSSLFVQNIGGYDGTNPIPGTNDLATVIGGLSSGGGSSETLWKKGEGQDSIVQVIAGGTDQPTATGNRAIATGMSTTASEQFSHAEGSITIASGYGSHAEGSNNVASGVFSHAEGESTNASGEFSHAEGINTAASGVASHTEGVYTAASNDASHAEGAGTIAANQYEHAQGMLNHSSENQIFSVGVGEGDPTNPESATRRNAISILVVPNETTWINTGSVFVQNIGGYDGTNPTPGTNDLATVINGMAIEGGIGTSSETWTFTLEDGSTVTKNIVMR